MHITISSHFTQIAEHFSDTLNALDEFTCEVKESQYNGNELYYPADMTVKELTPILRQIQPFVPKLIPSYESKDMHWLWGTPKINPQNKPYAIKVIGSGQRVEKVLSQLVGLGFKVDHQNQIVHQTKMRRSAENSTLNQLIHWYVKQLDVDVSFMEWSLKSYDYDVLLHVANTNEMGDTVQEQATIELVGDDLEDLERARCIFIEAGYRTVTMTLKDSDELNSFHAVIGTLRREENGRLFKETVHTAMLALKVDYFKCSPTFEYKTLDSPTQVMLPSQKYRSGHLQDTKDFRKFLPNRRCLDTGIEYVFPNHAVPIASIISPLQLCAPSPLRPSVLNHFDHRFDALAQALDIPQNIPSYILPAWLIDPHTDIEVVLKKSLQSTHTLLDVAAYMKCASLKSEFIRLACGLDTPISVSAIQGLSNLGLTEEDRALLIGQCTAEDKVRSLFILSILLEDQHHDAVSLCLEKIESWAQPDPLFTACMALIRKGEYEDVLESINGNRECSKDLQICVLRLMRAWLMNNQPTESLLRDLLNCVTACDESDLFVVFSWAIGIGISKLEYSMVEEVLDFCCHTLDDGSQVQSYMLNAILRAQLSDQENQKLLALLQQIDLDDSDAERSLNRVRGALSNILTETDWIFSGGYGRGVDLYEPGKIYVPDSIKSVLQPIRHKIPTALVRVIYQLSWGSNITTMMFSAAYWAYPQVATLYESWIYNATPKNQNDLIPRLATVLMFADQELSVSSMLLRCHLELPVMRPIAESDELIGELLAYHESDRLRDSARQIMQSCSIKFKKVLLGHHRVFLNHCEHKKEYGYSSNDLSKFDSDELERIIQSLGIPMPRSKELMNSDLLLRLAAKEKVDSSELLLLMRLIPASQAILVWNILAADLKNLERSELQSLAETEWLWDQLSPTAIQNSLLALFNEDWVQREGACIIARHVGRSLFDGSSLSQSLKSRLVEAVNDDDSDVVREAKAACIELIDNFIVPTVENITAGILSLEDSDLWTERLSEFILSSDEDDRRELIQNDELWEVMALDVLEDLWLQQVEGGWRHRRSFCEFIYHNPLILEGDRNEEIHAGLMSLLDDSDSDVRHSAREACEQHGIEMNED